MRLLIAVGVAGVLGIATPAFAQTVTSQTGGLGVVDNSVSQPSGQPSDDGLSALAQVPGTGTGGVTPLLLAGGLAIGAGALIITTANNNDDNTSPVSP